jgi:3-oxoacyl-[acyl-carrier-protein] synthase-3
MPGGGSLNPSSAKTVEQKMHYVHQLGPSVFKFAVRKMEELGRNMCERNHIKGEDIDLFIAHQANMRIIDSAAEKMGFCHQKTVRTSTNSAAPPRLQSRFAMVMPWMTAV